MTGLCFARTRQEKNSFRLIRPSHHKISCYISPSVHTVTSSAALHRSTSRDPSSVSKMGIWLSWKMIVASILFLTSLTFSESPDPYTDPTSSDPREEKPPIKISSLQFESVCVNIYDSQTTSNNKKIYFYSPMALLNHKNVASIHNTPSLSVSFAIWNQEVKRNVTEHLSQLLSQQIESSQVKVFPFDSVKLTSKVQSADFSLTNEWRLYDNQPSLRFTLICPTREYCGRVKTQMLNFPKQFEHLQLEFNPKLNDDDCFNDGITISEENKLPAQDNKETMANLEVKFAKELIAIREETKKEFAAISQMFSGKIKVTEENLAEVQQKLEITQKELLATKTLLTSTRIELSQTKSTVDDLTTKLNARTSELIDIGRMPTSCDDLQRTGHKLSGFFSVKGSKKMEMIYCDFLAYQNDKQKWIGYADVKSAPVHFHVQRYSSFNKTETPIPFDFARVNEGNAMDLTSGKFTAPRPGIYFFSFTALARLESSSGAWYFSKLYLNGNLIGTNFVHENNGPVDQLSSLTLQSTLKLKKDDQVWVQIEYYGSSYLLDNGNHHTHFSGFMLEEEIVASL
ncbi:collagen, type X, alpha 1 precursor-like protein [Daphnia pulex]|uniref:Collagen, type X, alpha 1-like protein n=1 Tax=Daphnia pulex TaxID=6669 RepID=E9GD89_DAPPU|nr:collagen, type X, alpha 1 precursor-like protein [Daphnia pulex]|eukprot:EFX82694.1 collagen, type X, alpha 1 precursor-like protein [Daphnia pulex]